ncbi:MAG: hypothetical protein LBE36_06485 [Flavobacteriaceae bacterium]|jgi:hypothetical protein|nr:hypothetical protein [Flavobacteriaceae bacterium]
MKTFEQAAADAIRKWYRRITDDTSQEESFLNGFISGANFAQTWIPVEDELPDFDVEVLVKMEPFGFTVSKRELKGGRFTMEELGVKVTHWRPIEYK